MNNFIPAQSEASRFGSQLGGVLEGLGQGFATSKETSLTSAAIKQLQRDKSIDLLFPDASAEERQILKGLPDQYLTAAIKGGQGEQAPSSNLPQQLLQPTTAQTPQQESPFEPVQAYNQLNPHEKQMVDMMPKDFGNLFLKKLYEDSLGKKKMPQAMQEQPRQESAPQMQPQAPMQQQKPSSILGSIKKGLSAEEKASAKKLSKDEQEFLVKASNKAQASFPLLKKISHIKDYIEKNYKKLQSGYIYSKLPKEALNKETQELSRLYSDLLSDIISVNTQGRGSDLLRRIQEEGKLNIGQPKENWIPSLDTISGDLEGNIRLMQSIDELKEANGGQYPEDILLNSERLASHRAAEFKNLKPREQIEFLISNPQEMPWLTEIENGAGKVMYRRNKSGNWVKV